MCGLKHQKEKRSMDYFAGLDVSVNSIPFFVETPLLMLIMTPVRRARLWPALDPACRSLR